jgi:hypothetical protein
MLYTFDEVALFHNFPYSDVTQLTDRKCFTRKVTDVTNIMKKTDFKIQEKYWWMYVNEWRADGLKGQYLAEYVQNE